MLSPHRRQPEVGALHRADVALRRRVAALDPAHPRGRFLEGVEFLRPLARAAPSPVRPTRSVLKSARGLAQSKTLRDFPSCGRGPRGFGLRQPSSALVGACGRQFASEQGSLFSPPSAAHSPGFPRGGCSPWSARARSRSHNIRRRFASWSAVACHRFRPAWEPLGATSSPAQRRAMECSDSSREHGRSARRGFGENA